MKSSKNHQFRIGGDHIEGATSLSMGVSLDGQEKEFVKQCDLEWVK